MYRCSLGLGRERSTEIIPHLALQGSAAWEGAAS